MLANIQSNRMIGTVLLGLERSMMAFFGRKHHIGIFFLSLPNNVRLISKLYRIHKNKSSDFDWFESSRDVPGCYRWKSEFLSQTLGIFFGHVPYIPYIEGTWKVKSDPQFCKLTQSLTPLANRQSLSQQKLLMLSIDFLQILMLIQIQLWTNQTFLIPFIFFFS